MDQVKEFPFTDCCPNEIVKEEDPLKMHLFARQDKKLEYVLAVG
jgi:hypothetical protein